MKVIGIVLLIVLLSACGSNKQDLSAAAPIINKMSFSNQQVAIQYPEITNLDSPEQARKLNEVLKSDAMQIIDYFGGNEQSNEVNADYVSKLTGDNLISVAYSGSSYVKGGAYPRSFFVTTNLDLTKEKKIVLKDIVRIDDEFISALRGAKYVPYDSELIVEAEAREELSSYSNEQLIALLNQSDVISDTNELGVSTYFTKDSLGISFNVPHALGDHVEFEIAYSELKEHFLIENKLWSKGLKREK
ncbi:hypothetical protein [Paenibacillus sp. NPDC058174]|uniref:hypothetical protein n=1 Tax=Paenibacillus sp. NPDC058174 TaxID=3346366 RepID=UPI0036D9AD5C